MSCHCCHDHDCDEIEENEEEERKEKIINIVFFVYGLCTLVAGFVLEKVAGFDGFSWSMFKQDGFYTSLQFYSFLLYTIGYIPLLIKILISCIDEMKEGSIFNEFLLMVIATVGAYAICEFPECLFVVLFSIVGELLEDYATAKSKQSISALVNNMPLYAHYIDASGNIIEKEPEDLEINDIVEIRPGEKVSVDGTIIEGTSSFDLSSINGESMPVDKKEGDDIVSGSICLTSVVKVRVTKEFKNSTLSKIIDLVQNEQDKKAKSEKLITRFAKYYTPIVMLIAVIVFLVGYGVSGWNFDNGGRDWLYKALSILLISCPCSLVIAVPIGFFAGIGTASKYGILIKGPISIEQLAKSKTIAFDKTGTLTEGKFVVQNNPNEDNLLIAASLEDKSTHPLASAIKEANKKELLEVKDFKNVAGKGISGVINGKCYYIGSYSFLKGEGINVTREDTMFKVLYLGTKEDGCIEHFIVADKIKDVAPATIDALRKEKCENTIIISGDDKNIVEETRKNIGISDAYGELLPDQKLDKINELKKEGVLAYVGDGINDSPSLLASDVGIAMGGLGSDAAIEASDIVITDDNLIKIPEAKHLSKKTLRVIYFGIFISLFLKALVMVLVSTGVLGDYAMLVSSISDTGVMVICVLNALRMMIYKPKYLKKTAN